MDESEDQSKGGRDNYEEFIDWDNERLEQEFQCWIDGVSEKEN